MASRYVYLAFLGVLLTFGLARAAFEFGAAGILAFGKLLIAPSAFFLFLILMFPGGFGPSGLEPIPSNQALSGMAIASMILAGLFALIGTIFGVGWLV